MCSIQKHKILHSLEPFQIKLLIVGKIKYLWYESNILPRTDRDPRSDRAPGTDRAPEDSKTSKVPGRK